jgi:hypothetical protein
MKYKKIKPHKLKTIFKDNFYFWLFLFCAVIIAIGAICEIMFRK